MGGLLDLPLLLQDAILSQIAEPDAHRAIDEFEEERLREHRPAHQALVLAREPPFPKSAPYLPSTVM